jgi:hypothetical protein
MSMNLIAAMVSGGGIGAVDVTITTDWHRRRHRRRHRRHHYRWQQQQHHHRATTKSRSLVAMLPLHFEFRVQTAL